jgi:hypothetical protein
MSRTGIIIVLSVAAAATIVLLVVISVTVGRKHNTTLFTPTPTPIWATVRQLRQPVRLAVPYRAFNCAIVYDKDTNEILLGARISNNNSCTLDSDPKSMKEYVPKGGSKYTSEFYVGPVDMGTYRWKEPPTQLTLPSPAMRSRYTPAKNNDGVEDVRMMSVPGGVLLVGNVCSRAPTTQGKITNIVYSAIMTPDRDVVQEQLMTPTFASPTKRQKNWTPFMHEGKLYYIYSVNPHTIVEHVRGDEHKAEARMDKVYETHWRNDTTPALRGGTNVVELDHCFLVCAHIAKNVAKKKPMYRSVFYTFARQPPFNVLALGTAISLGDDLIQYPVGLVLEHHTGDLLLSFGANDCHMHVARLPLKNVLESLSPIKYHTTK